MGSQRTARKTEDYAADAFGERGPRHDAVRYELNGEVCYGMVEAFYERLPTRRNHQLARARVALIRRFKKVLPDDGNTMMVNEFGYERLAFVEGRDSKDVIIACAPLCAITRRIVVLRDMWDLSQRYSFETQVPDQPDTAGERILSRFFGTKRTVHVDWRGSYRWRCL